VKAAGPLGDVIESDGNAIKPGQKYQQAGYQFGPGASALILMNRVAFYDDRSRKLDDKATRALLRWAVDQDLGQASELIAGITARRDVAITELRRQGLAVARFRAVPEWRLAVGLGSKGNAHEIGLSLHGTYGCPVIPGSSLKGMTASWAALSGADPADIGRVLGTPRPRPSRPALQEPGSSYVNRPPKPAPATRGSVCFLDAVPLGTPAAVRLDVLTPHVKPYYDALAGPERRPLVPPAEHHNPVPVYFLTVRGPFAMDLYGREAEDVGLAGAWLSEAAAELGAGGKTAAGYGYLQLTERDS
jgi:CRISPR/Cas system CMR subunit Cmr6 (Cas7 group RAMP superfamily)